MINKHRLFDYKPHEFSVEQRRFLAAAGWATIPADDLIERAATIEAQRPPEIERVTFLTRELLKDGLFAERRRAYLFAQGYTALRDAETDFRMIVWDWE